jgi:hypothetical protein
MRVERYGIDVLVNVFVRLENGELRRPGGSDSGYRRATDADRDVAG